MAAMLRPHLRTRLVALLFIALSACGLARGQSDPDETCPGGAYSRGSKCDLPVCPSPGPQTEPAGAGIEGDAVCRAVGTPLDE